MRFHTTCGRVCTSLHFFGLLYVLPVHSLKHKILDDVQALLDALQRLSTEAREACDVVDSERMRDVLEAAEDLGVTLGNDAELRRMLSLPLQNRQQLRLRRALALQDLDEIVKATIDIKTLFFANSAARWGLPYFPGLKPVARFLMVRDHDYHPSSPHPDICTHTVASRLG